MSDIADVLFDLAPTLRDSAKVSTGRVMICCPFHHETGPSCSVSRDAPVFCCFGCGESGHVSRLLSHLGLHRGGIDIVLESAGFKGRTNEPRARSKSKLGATIELTGVDPYRPKFVLAEDILDIYRQAPTALLRAGFTKKTLRHFEVGFDSLHGRITFPLRSRYGELVGISGRDTWEVGDRPRYRIYDRELIARKDFNVPADYTMDGVKEKILWHAHLVLPLLMSDASHDTVVLVEGFKQAMAVYQAGYKTVLGLVGSSLTEYHTELLCRYAKRAILFLDNNRAGTMGTHAAAARLIWRGLSVEPATYPDEREQPDGLTKEEIVTAIKTRKPYSEWTLTHVDDQNPNRLSPLLAPSAGSGQWSPSQS